MKRDIEKYIKEASEYLNKHEKVDITVGELNKIHDLALQEDGGEFTFVSFAFLFGFSVGRRHGKKGA